MAAVALTGAFEWRGEVTEFHLWGRASETARLRKRRIPKESIALPRPLDGACDVQIRKDYEAAVFLTFWFVLAASALWWLLMKHF